MVLDVSTAIHNPARLAALQRLDLLDSPPEPAFDRLANLAATLMRAPFAFIALADQERLFLKSFIGCGEADEPIRSIPIEQSLCQFIVAEGAPLIIANAHDHPLGPYSDIHTPEPLGAYAAVPLRDPQGYVLGCLGVADLRPHTWLEHDTKILADLAASVISESRLRSDNAERQRVEEALADSERRLSLIYNSVSDLVCLLGVEPPDHYRCLTINATYLERTGLPPNQLIGKWLSEIEPAHLMPITRQRCAEAIEHGKPISYESSMKLPDGQIFIDMMLTPIFDEHGRCVNLLGVAHDISERKLAEEAINLRARQQAAIADLGQRALVGANISELFNDAVNLVAETLDVEFCEALELLPDGTALRLRAGTGWRAGTIGKATVDADTDSQIGYTLFSDRPVVVDDSHAETRFRGAPLLHDQGVINGMTVIIRGQHQPFGVLGAHTTRRRSFSNDDVHFLQSVANVLGTAVSRKRIEDVEREARDKLESQVAARTAEIQQVNQQLARWVKELERRNREMLLLSEMGELLQACKTTDEIYTVAERSLPNLFVSEPGALYARAEDQTMMVAVAEWGAPGPRAFIADECWAFRRGRAYPIDQACAGPLCNHIGAKEPMSYICVPIQAQGEVMGVLYVYTESATLPEARRGLALTVAEHVALALANLKLRDTLRQQAIRDPLTNLYNRRYMEESLEREVSRASRHSSPLGVIMLDIDHFKQINDTFGHAAGDTLLRTLGALLLRQTRGEDIACRYGGEEFTLILPDSPLEDTWRRAEQLRESVRRLQLRHGTQMLGTVTISAGVASFPEHGTAPEALLRSADLALYEAKASGRDQVVRHHPALKQQ